MSESSVGKPARDFAYKGQRNPLMPVTVTTEDMDSAVYTLRTWSGWDTDDSGRRQTPSLKDQVCTGEVHIRDTDLTDMVSTLIRYMGYWVKPSDSNYPWEDEEVQPTDLGRGLQREG